MRKHAMRRPIFLAAVLPVMLLAGCSGGGADRDGDGEITSEEAQAEAANINIRPGQWDATVRMTEFDIPNLPPEARAMVEQQMAREQTNSSCVTPEQASNPQAGMFGNDNENCSYTDFNMSGGNMLIAGSCQSEGGQTATMRMEGSYTDTSYHMTMTTRIENGPTGPMTVSGEVNGRHVSDNCSEG